jgi:C-methyltransferase C-terminal domain/Putative zinc binding domain/Methyltransferase domain
MSQPQCRFCTAPLVTTFVDLGMSPPSNAFLTFEATTRMERFYPLHAFVCDQCFLVQLESFETPAEIFEEYAYFSSYSTSWLDHCKRYAENIITDLQLDSRSQVVEIASNDGYMLRNFLAAGIPCLGIEPAANVARAAVESGIPTLVEFFGSKLASKLVADGKRADLIIGNNVLAHVPDINDFVAGVSILLEQEGTATFEFPHLLRLMELSQFDTIYHEHFSYFSALSVCKIFERQGLRVVRIIELPTHGGSLRIFVRHAEHAADETVTRVLAAERSAGLDRIETYGAFRDVVHETKRRLLSFLIEARDRGETVAAYGAAAKGTTLLNFCGVRTDLIEYVVDKNPYKQNRYLPGCHIPIYAPERIDETRPDHVLILPWNIKDEVMQQMSHVRSWGADFVVPIPTVAVL